MCTLASVWEEVALQFACAFMDTNNAITPLKADIWDLLARVMDQWRVVQGRKFDTINKVLDAQETKEAKDDAQETNDLLAFTAIQWTYFNKQFDEGQAPSSNQTTIDIQRFLGRKLKFPCESKTPQELLDMALETFKRRLRKRKSPTATAPTPKKSRLSTVLCSVQD